MKYAKDGLELIGTGILAALCFAGIFFIINNLGVVVYLIFGA